MNMKILLSEQGLLWWNWTAVQFVKMFLWTGFREVPVSAFPPTPRLLYSSHSMNCFSLIISAHIDEQNLVLVWVDEFASLLPEYVVIVWLTKSVVKFFDYFLKFQISGKYSYLLKKMNKTINKHLIWICSLVSYSLYYDFWSKLSWGSTTQIHIALHYLHLNFEV